MKIDIVDINCNVEVQIDTLQKKLCGTPNDSNDQFLILLLFHLVLRNTDAGKDKKNILNSKCIHFLLDLFTQSKSP